ncbi:MAG: DNA-binding protein [Propionivibrio sp.]
MAREATITQEQVNAAADSIRAAGSRPTARAVRDQIGTGSMATVLKLLQVWQAGQVKVAEAPITLPAGLQRALVDFVAQEIATAKGELQADLVNLQQSNNDLIAENERQASTIDLQAEALRLAQEEKAEISGRLAQAERDLDHAHVEIKEERHAAEAARTELAKAQLRLEAVPHIEAEIERLRKELGAEHRARVEAEQKAAVAIAKLEGMTDRATKAEAYAEKVEKQAVQASNELANARVHVQAQQMALDAAARECEGLQQQLKEAKTLKAQVEVLKRQKTTTKPTKPNEAE